MYNIIRRVYIYVMRLYHSKRNIRSKNGRGGITHKRRHSVNRRRKVGTLVRSLRRKSVNDPERYKRRIHQRDNRIKVGSGVKYVGRIVYLPKAADALPKAADTLPKAADALPKDADALPTMSRKRVFTPVISEIEQILKRDDTTVTVISYNSVEGFVFNISFTPEDPPIFRSDYYADVISQPDVVENDQSLISSSRKHPRNDTDMLTRSASSSSLMKTSSKLDYNEGMPVKELIIKLCIVRSSDSDTRILAPMINYITKKAFMKDAPTPSDFKREIIAQATTYNTTFRLGGTPLLPNIIESGVLPYIGSSESSGGAIGFINALNIHLHEDYKWITTYIINALFINRGMSLGIFIMEKQDGIPIVNVPNNSPNIGYIHNYALSIGIIIMVSTKMCLVDGHLGNWIYNPRDSRVTAIDFGRTTPISEFDALFRRLYRLEKGSTHPIYTKYMSYMSAINELHPSCYELYEQENDLANNIKRIRQQENVENERIEWYHEPTMMFIHMCLVGWTWMDFMVNVLQYRRENSKNRYILLHLWGEAIGSYNSDDGDDIYSVPLYNVVFKGAQEFQSALAFDLPRFVNRMKDDNARMRLRAGYEEIREIIKMCTTTPENVGIRIPKNYYMTEKYRSKNMVVDEPEELEGSSIETLTPDMSAHNEIKNKLDGFNGITID